MTRLAPLSLELASLDDVLLVELSLDGQYPAFEALFMRYRDRVYAIGMSMMRNDADASDVVQETFLNAFRKLHTFRRESPFRGWLFRIAHNAGLMRLRSRRRRPEVPLQGDEGHEIPLPDSTPLADWTVENDELGVRLEAAIAALPDKYGVVLRLADFEHRSMKGIAESLSLSVPAVKTRLHRARLSVREQLRPYLAAETSLKARA